MLNSHNLFAKSISYRLKVIVTRLDGSKYYVILNKPHAVLSFMPNHILSDNVKLELLEQLPVGIVAAYVDSKKLCYANNAFLKLTGYTEQEILSLTPFDLHPAAVHAQISTDFAAMAKGELSEAVCYKVLRKDGSEFFADIKAMFCKTAQADVVLATFQDVTAREQAAKQQQELTERLAYERSFQKTLLEHLPALVWLKDPDSNYLACNKRFEQFFNAPASEIIGKNDNHFVDEATAALFRYNDQLALRSPGALINEEWIQFRSDQHKELVETTKVKLETDSGKLIGVLGVAYDVTDRFRLNEQQKIALSVFSEAIEGIMITDPNGNIIDVNKAFCHITGYDKSAVIGQNANILNSGLQAKSFYRKLWRQIKLQGFWSGEIWNRRANGAVYPEQLKIQAVRNTNMAISHYIAMFTDLSPIKAKQQQLNLLQHFDPLTQLPNRQVLVAHLAKQLKQKQRVSQSIAVLYLDLDNFQAINQQFGSKFGDKALKILANRYTKIMQSQHLLAKVDGDEFIIVLSDLTDATTMTQILDALLKSTSKPMSIHGVKTKITASIGAALAGTAESLEAEQLIRQAEQALYQAKLAGKNHYHLFDSLVDANRREHFEFLNHIKKALTEQQFVLYYQPKIALRTGELKGFEALIRWQHPEKGLLMPNSFIPLLKNHPLMLELGHWVLSAALTQLTTWNAQNLYSRISVNIDSMQLNNENFAEHILNLFAAYPTVQYQQLELEILETGALEQLDKTSGIIKLLQSKGIDFALDDFGTGYSSLTFLKELPANIVKIDQSFIRQMLNDPEQMIITDAMISLAKKLQRKLVAEGVESYEHGLLLSALGCDLAQGYFIAKPMPVTEIDAWLAQWQVPEAWTTVSLLNKDGIQGLISLVEHRQWFESAKQALLGHNSTVEEHTACKLGAWLNTPEIITLYANNENYQKVRLHHDNVHDSVAKDQSIEQLIAESKALQQALIAMLFNTDIAWQN